MSFKKWLMIIGIILLVLAFTLINTFYINPKVITVNKKEIYSNKIDNNLDDLVVVFFSDLHYGAGIENADVSKLKDLINSFDPDLVLFGGDLCDDLDKYEFKDNEKETLIDNLKRINAPLGKFAVLGNHDLGSKNIRKIAEEILYDSNFEILNNASTKVYINDSYINLVGIESMVLANPDIDKAYTNIDTEHFTLSLCHTPDIFDEVPLDKTDLLLAGHSHGGQVYLPLFNSFYRPLAAKTYFKGDYHKDNSTLTITNGVGSTLYEARLLADSEIIVYKLKKSH